jgi:hypothetical protein
MIMKANSVLVLDGSSWPEGMRKAWSVIIADERAAISVDLCSASVCDVTRSPPSEIMPNIRLD